MKRIDPEALFAFIGAHWGYADAARVCPEVAEPGPVTVAETAAHSRYPGDLAPMMDIHGPQRRRVMFSSPESGYPADAKRAVAYLVPGMLYSTVSVDVGSSRTNVELAECPGVRFNSVHFIDWPPAACPERPAEPVSERCQWYGHDGEGPQCGRSATTWRKSAMYPDGRPLCAEHRAIMDREYPDRPAEPVIDEAVYEAAFAGCHKRWPNTVYGNDLARHAAELAVRKYEELRSKACGSSEQSSASRSSPTPSSVGSQSEPDSKGGPAHAADPRRLTGSECRTAYRLGIRPPGNDYRHGLLAVADAQLAKAGVTISEAEILQITGWSDHTSRPSDRARAICALLRSKGVEVTP